MSVRRDLTLRSIGVLVGGTAFAHGLTALAMPVVTRLFSPQDFAAAAVFSSLIGILVVVSCLRFEMAIVLPEEDQEAINLFAVSAVSVVAISLVCAALVAVVPREAIALLGQPALTPHLWLLAPALLIGGLYLATQMWCVRRRQFGPIARSRAVQSFCAAGAQVGLGFFGVAPLGLLVGQMLNYGAGALTLGAGLLWGERALLRSVTLKGMWRAAVAHQRFPKYSVWEALANSASIHLPVLLIAALAVGAEAGYLTLAVFLLQAPMALIGQSVGQVFLSGAPVAAREKRLPDYTEGMLRRLARLSAAPMGCLAAVSPVAFGLVFGDEWARSGVLVAWMAPWFLFQFLSSPLSTALHVVGRQQTAMVLQAVGLVVRVGAVLLAASFARTWIVEVYALSGAVFYAGYLAVVVAVAGVGGRKMVRASIETLVFAAAGTGVGGLATVAIRLLSP